MSDLLYKALADDGPWVLLVFYLLYRDLEKDRATREIVDRSTTILIELSTIIRERLPGK